MFLKASLYFQGAESKSWVFLNIQDGLQIGRQSLKSLCSYHKEE